MNRGTFVPIITTKHVVERCIDHEVGRIAIGDLSGIREGKNSDSRNWGKRGNKKLHGWEFDRFTMLLEYKTEEQGILVDRTSERDTSKTSSCCGRKRDANRVERGLYVCESCGATMNADVNGAVNIRRKITQSPLTEGMSNGRLTRPVAYLFNQTSGRFAPSEQVGCKPQYPNAWDSRVFRRGRMSSGSIRGRRWRGTRSVSPILRSPHRRSSPRMPLY